MLHFDWESELYWQVLYLLTLLFTSSLFVTKRQHIMLGKERGLREKKSVVFAVYFVFIHIFFLPCCDESSNLRLYKWVGSLGGG